MAGSPQFRRRNRGRQPNKNELKVFRRQSEEQERARAGTLRDSFPRVRQIALDLQMETPMGAVLEHSVRRIEPTDSLLLDIPCLGGCHNGVFLLMNAIENILQAGQESHQGMGICQASSYGDPKVPCNTKLMYRVDVQYEGGP
jgi:hypothetical protein